MNVAADAQTEIERIRKRIIEFCELNLEQGPYLLSRLGVDLGNDVHALKLYTGAKLTQFIEENLSDRYKLVPIIGHSHIKAIVRLDDDVDAGLAERQAIIPASPAESRFHYRFWAAFSVPAKQTDTRRYLNPVELIFKDQAIAEETPQGWLLVENEFIAPVEIPARDLVIKNNIEKWLAKNGFDKTKFLQANFKSKTAGRSVLSAMLDALDRQQLKNTTMSLDVIATLLSKRI